MVGIQAKLEMIGKYGCYMFCLLKIAKQEHNYLYYYNRFLEKGWIDRECTVLNPVAIMNDLTGTRFNVLKSTKFDSKASFTVGYWYNPNTKFHHFVLHDGNNKVIYDSYGMNDDGTPMSNTVRNGYIESYRLYYKV